MKNINLRLYLVTDENCMPPGRDLFHAVEEALQAGVTLVQYREKNGLGRRMLEKAIALRRLCHRYNVPLLVNDRLDIALLSGAQDDIPVAEARRLADLFAVNNAAACQPDYETVTERASVHRMEAATTSQTAKPVLQTENHFIIGATAHNVQEALAAEAAGADYLGCGAVFATNTKKDTVPLGLEGLRAIRKAVPGITPKNYQQVLAAGADGAAVVSGILGADNITETVAAFLTGI